MFYCRCADPYDKTCNKTYNKIYNKKLYGFIVCFIAVVRTALRKFASKQSLNNSSHLKRVATYTLCQKTSIDPPCIVLVHSDEIMVCTYDIVRVCLFSKRFGTLVQASRGLSVCSSAWRVFSANHTLMCAGKRPCIQVDMPSASLDDSFIMRLSCQGCTSHAATK